MKKKQKNLDDQFLVRFQRMVFSQLYLFYKTETTISNQGRRFAITILSRCANEFYFHLRN